MMHYARLANNRTQATPHLAPHKAFVYTSILPQYWSSAETKCLCRHGCRGVFSEDGSSDAEQGIMAESNSKFCHFQQFCHRDRVWTHHIEEEDVLP